MLDSLMNWLSDDFTVQGWYLLVLVFLGGLGGAATMIVIGENAEGRHKREVMDRDLAVERRRRRVAQAFHHASARPVPLRPSRPEYTGRVPVSYARPARPPRSPRIA